MSIHTPYVLTVISCVLCLQESTYGLYILVGITFILFGGILRLLRPLTNLSNMSRWLCSGRSESRGVGFPNFSVWVNMSRWEYSGPLLLFLSSSSWRQNSLRFLSLRSIICGSSLICLLYHLLTWGDNSKICSICYTMRSGSWPHDEINIIYVYYRHYTSTSTSNIDHKVKSNYDFIYTNWTKHGVSLL